MSKIIDDAVAALKEKMSNTSFEGSAKFEIETEGSIVIRGGSVYASDDPADVTFTASVGGSILSNKGSASAPI